MKRVSVVFTVHKERGAASILWLLAILERIKPEVIFLEIPPAVFDDYRSGIRWNLESTAARRYGEIRQVDLVPVDLPSPEEDFFGENEALYERVAGVHHDVRRLVGAHSRYVHEYGFAYLNSEHCSALWSDFYTAMQTGITALADPKLTEHYESWNRTKELREKEMMKRIEDYSRHASFSSAAFLVGAAHRQAIIGLSRIESGVASSAIQWDFGGFLAE